MTITIVSADGDMENEGKVRRQNAVLLVRQMSADVLAGPVLAVLAGRFGDGFVYVRSNGDSRAYRLGQEFGRIEPDSLVFPMQTSGGINRS